MHAFKLSKEKGADGRHVLSLDPAAPLPAFRPGKAEALVRVCAAALNHRDNWMTMGMYPKLKFGSILGSDGCGVVEALSPEAEAASGGGWLGKRVVLDASLHWGGGGPADASAATLAAPQDGKLFDILGMPADGTFAELVRVPLENLHAAPAHLSDAQCAALPLAAGTAYRALVTKGGIRDAHFGGGNPGGSPGGGDGQAAVGPGPGGAQAAQAAQQGGSVAAKRQTVLVTGVGGGVAMFALQLGVALGAQVIVTSGDDGKLAAATELGAAAGANYKAKGWLKGLKKAVGELTGGAGLDAIVDGAAGEAMPALVRLLAPGGRLVTYGVTAGPPSGLGAALPLLFLNHAEVRGTAMCAPAEFSAMLALVERTKMVPVVDSTRPMAELPAALERMRAGDQTGKIVLTNEWSTPRAKL
jgi:NADPH:quinone reductase-like Zn-dependent oxidoreductase